MNTTQIEKIKNQADIYLQQRDFTQAINLYQECIDLVPNMIDNYWYLGLAWLLAGHEIASQSIWLSTFTNSDLDIQENDLLEFINLLKNQAEKYVEIQDYELAQIIYEAILNWDDSDIQVYDNLANCLAMLGKLEQAISYWQILTEIAPNYLNSYLQQANIFQKLENFTDAIYCYKNILNNILYIDSNYHHKHLIYYQMGLCYSRMQQWELASNCFSQCLTLNNDYSPAYSDLGFTLIYQHNWELGINYLKKAIEIQPQFCEYLVNSINIINPNNLPLNPIYLTGINFIKSLIQSLSNFSQSENQFQNQLILNLAKTLAKNYPDIAIQLLQETRKNLTNDLKLEFALELSKILLNQNQIQEAINILNDFINDFTDCTNIENNQELNKELYYIKSQCYLKLEDYQQAIIYLEKVIALQYNFSESYYLLGIAFLNVGNIEAAAKTFQQQLTINPNSPLTLAYLGFIYGKKHHIEDAINYFQKAININSSIITFIDKLINVIISQNPGITQLDFSPIIAISPPHQYYNLTQDWIKNNHLNNSHYVEIYPEIDMTLNYPKTLDNSVHFSFRFGKNIKLPASFVVTIPQGRFWLSTNQTQSAIITDESHFLADISPDFPILQPHHPDKDPRHHAIFTMEKLPPIKFISGNVAVLAGLTNNIYFHWMLDVLPRWELLRLSNTNFQEIDYFIVDNSLPFQKETLQLLQIPEHKQININQTTNQTHHIQASNLIVPSFPGTVAWMPKWTCDFLKKHFLIPEYVKNIPAKKRIYITRKLAKSRRILNEDDIINLLSYYGFQVVTLESISVLEQAALFSQAEIIISPHGSGLTNLVFCQPGTKVIELFSPNYVYHCYWWISNLINLDYYYLLGETLPGWHFHHLIYPQEFSEDILINLNDLLKLLQLL